MITGSLFIRGSINSLKMETGYDGKHVVDLDFQFPEASRYTAVRRLALVQELRRRLAALPGVAGVTSARPPDGVAFRTAAIGLNGEKSSSGSVQLVLSYTYVEPSYFQTLGVPVILGRGFRPQAGQLERSVILSESAAKQLWPGQNPIGRALQLGAVDERVRNLSELAPQGPAYQVVGVARDTRGVEFDGSDSRKIYLPLPDDKLNDRPILIRAQSDSGQVIRAIGSVISSIDPDLMATSSTLEEMLRRTAPFIASSLAAAVASTVGLLGLLLASMGIYGTVSYIVVLRTREVGIRMAVGAKKATSSLSSWAKAFAPCSPDCLLECCSRLELLTCCAVCSMDSTSSMESLTPVSRFCS